mmetsp:Transcript_567/g.939  ORF Transcript_567/g.939 Transcript_567/m.939 type:complete len:104 (+) Transcript_567:154-465(+)
MLLTFLWKKGSIIPNPRNIEASAIQMTTVKRMYFPRKKPRIASMKQTRKVVMTPVLKYLDNLFQKLVFSSTPEFIPRLTSPQKDSISSSVTLPERNDVSKFWI